MNYGLVFRITVAVVSSSDLRNVVLQHFFTVEEAMLAGPSLSVPSEQLAEAVRFVKTAVVV